MTPLGISATTAFCVIAICITGIVVGEVWLRVQEASGDGAECRKRRGFGTDDDDRG